MSNTTKSCCTVISFVSVVFAISGTLIFCVNCQPSVFIEFTVKHVEMLTVFCHKVLSDRWRCIWYLSVHMGLYTEIYVHLCVYRLCRTLADDIFYIKIPIADLNHIWAHIYWTYAILVIQHYMFSNCYKNTIILQHYRML